MFGWIVIVCFFVLLLRIYLQRRRYVKAFESIPGSKGWPVLGNIVQLLQYNTTELHEMFVSWVQQYGSRVKIDMCVKFWILHSSPEDIEKIATSTNFNRKSDDYGHLVEWLGSGILLDHGASWFVKRKALTDAFHFKVLENFIPTSQEQSQILVNKLLSYGGKPVDIFPLLKLYTLDVILETAMGVTCQAQLNDSAYVRAVAGLSHITYWRMFNVMGFSDATFRFTKYYQPYHEMLKVSNDFTMDVITRRRQELASELPRETTKTGDDERKKRIALLDKLLEMEIDGKKLSNEEIKNQVNNFMFAGHDTTSSALTFIIYLIAKHLDVQDRLYDEIQTVVGDGDIPVLNSSVLNQLKHLDAVIKESLRLYPPVPYFSRTIDKETELSGVLYPPGTTVSLGVYFMHRNPLYFPNPMQFDPERFLKEAGPVTRNPYVYIPFSAGSRNCIGQKFAMNEIKVALLYTMLFCRIELEDPHLVPRLKAELILKPDGSIPVRFIARKSKN
ncbi:cytochrome P450 4c3-like [Wyeomyia smithii]|uniref:cytochrome P450 4c3-like n=1 Tax=Wyeomyia smithii TaxID=174621 RepID=UPI002467FA17|nr:cytochrome P450 4c3-like [Wyeomyia smithii]XP_055549747.1 cytochrome P450 4c3-like [Wyeomyia smithii]XP_055549748.1 cytochrome P450 4c3-like [Wyeomyia smithii]XP_055549749.1 cytochrome P450 4c3-like [Wyeomyia smithii]XP_055549750.1 cytochrome P450 4c3-like [Wyeomyia smithii]XP_055549751.1 cytochrome P450 4c3-like [Wyeomyia smithii]XP_055549752.1 cytochrome P450 4c3-like [Wyeomyia smithii]XP_055549753.1 cytochrome P450 4c3-like [Wyeomyia smithii]